MSISRRSFLKSALAVGLGGLAPGLYQVAIPKASAADTGDYRAAVCVYLHGGNDGCNCFIKLDGPGYTEYARSRGGLALARAAVLPVQTRSGALPYGFHPSMRGLSTLFNQGQLGVVANVGTLEGRLTRDQYLANTAPAPTKLFSHFDQMRLWQATRGASSVSRSPGWGGKMADHLSGGNFSAIYPQVTTMAEAADFCEGELTRPAAVNPHRVDALARFGSTSENTVRLDTMRQLLGVRNGQHLIDAATGRADRTLDELAMVTSTLESYPALQTVFPNSYIGRQFRKVAQLVQARASFGLNRQIFFVSLGGFDTHTNQLRDHANALSQLDAAMAAFYWATVELGVAPQVLSFTMSEFGRTLSPAGTGSDHGWGNHHFVMGGAVRGGEVYGNVPSLALGGPNDSGDKGRLIPTTSVDQYAATIAAWMGVSAANVSAMFPNLANFSSQHLAFV